MFGTTPLNWSIFGRRQQTADMQEQIQTKIGGIPIGNTPEEFALDIKADIARWSAVVNEGGVKVKCPC